MAALVLLARWSVSPPLRLAIHGALQRLSRPNNRISMPILLGINAF
jgi:hypothetical protein